MYHSFTGESYSNLYQRPLSLNDFEEEKLLKILLEKEKS